jgi:ketosteroid isomerase-like protein
MKRSRNRYFVALILLALLFANACRSEQVANTPKEKPADDGEYLKNAGVEWDRLFNDRDTAKLTALYAEDAVSMPYNYQTVKGKAAIRNELEKFLASNEYARHETFPEEILTGGDFSIERSRYIMTYTPMNTTNRIVETGRHAICRKKIDGKWLITWEIWNSDQPLPK